MLMRSTDAPVTTRLLFVEYEALLFEQVLLSAGPSIQLSIKFRIMNYPFHLFVIGHMVLQVSHIRINILNNVHF